MFCSVCTKANTKSTVWVIDGTTNFKTSILRRHSSTGEHLKSMIAPKEESNMKLACEKVLTTEEEAVIICMKTVYWMAKENIPLSKYTSLRNFQDHLETPKTDKLKVTETVNYSSYTTATDMLKAINDTIDDDINFQLENSPYITILCDESTDRVVHHKLSVFARVADPTSLRPTTLFLCDERINSATGKAIFEQISAHLEERKVPISKITGLGTDGAPAMTGKKEGLTGQFLRKNPHLVNTHCMAHRLALVTEQAAKKVPAVKDFQTTLEQIFYYFPKSPEKCDRMEDIQRLLNEPALKYKEVHQIRWLSFYDALETVYRTLDSLISYFSSRENDPAAEGMKRKVGNEMFISLTYAMLDILSPIMRLSLFLQKKDVDISLVQVISPQINFKKTK